MTQTGRIGVNLYLTSRVKSAFEKSVPVNERPNENKTQSKVVKYYSRCAYAPTEISTDEKHHFYEDLSAVLEGISGHDLLIVTRNFKAKVDREVQFFPSREPLPERTCMMRVMTTELGLHILH